MNILVPAFTLEERGILYRNPCSYLYCLFYFFLRFFIYVFLERRELREKKRKISMSACLSCAPYWGPGLQPRHVPWLRIEPVTLWFAGWHSIHWATPARAHRYCLDGFLPESLLHLRNCHHYPSTALHQTEVILASFLYDSLYWAISRSDCFTLGSYIDSLPLSQSSWPLLPSYKISVHSSPSALCTLNINCIISLDYLNIFSGFPSHLQ